MATTKNITMKQFNGTDYDTLYPKTVYNQVSGVAPDGYGLGKEVTTYILDANTATEAGWYYWGKDTVNTPSNYGAMLVIPRVSNITTQLAFLDEGGFAASKICVRKRMDGVWGEWEWVNPHMLVGVEYRTTERFEGKPVYCQLVYFTGIVDGGTFTVDVPGVGTVLRFFGSRSGVPLPFISEKGLSNAWTNYFSVNRFTDKITITMTAGSSVPSESRFYCALYYTKNG